MLRLEQESQRLFHGTLILSLQERHHLASRSRYIISFKPSSFVFLVDRGFYLFILQLDPLENPFVAFSFKVNIIEPFSFNYIDFVQS